MDDGLEVMKSMGKDKLPFHVTMKAEEHSCLLPLDLGYRMHWITYPEVAEITIPWIS